LTRRSAAPELTKRLLSHEKRLSSQGYIRIAGVDEAGRGPLAGPVVAGAVILKEHSFKERVDDSKKLSPKKREKAYLEIIEKCIVGVGIVSEKIIDEINIYRATIKAMEDAIEDLELKPDYVMVDGRMRLSTRCPIKRIVGGDALSLSIAAASIVAKVTRDKLMMEYDRTYPQYGFARHKGYGTRSHMEALKRYGPSPIHRFSFRPVAIHKLY
jgi:ribonuclease HII